MFGRVIAVRHAVVRNGGRTVVRVHVPATPVTVQVEHDDLPGAARHARPGGAAGVQFVPDRDALGRAAGIVRAP